MKLAKLSAPVLFVLALAGCPNIELPPIVTPSTDASADAKPQPPDLAPLPDLAIGPDSAKPDLGAPDTQALLETGVLAAHPPTIATVALSTALMNGENAGYQYSFTAPSSNDEALYEFTLSVQTLDTVLSGYRVFENGMALDPALYAVTGDLAGDLKPGSGNSFGPNATQKVKVRFFASRTTAAGMTKTYRVSMTAIGVKAGSTVSHRLLGESGQPEIVGTIAQVQATNANFIWSDTSDLAHTLETPDWRNGAGIPSLNSLLAITLSL